MMQKTIRAFLALTIISAVLAIAYLGSLPGETQNSFLNVSPFRLVYLVGFLAVIGVSVFIFFRFESTKRVTNLVERIKGFKSGIYLSFILFTFSLTFWVVFLYREVFITFSNEAIYARLAPLMLFGSLVCLQAGLVLILPFLTDKKDDSLKNVWKTMLFLLGGFFLIAIFISLTGIGFTFDNVGLNWGTAGTPLSFAQINLVLSIGFILFFLFSIIGSRIKNNYSRWLLVLDIGIFITLWGAAVLLWSSQTISPSHFSPARSAPNYEYYPYSDAAIFDRMSYHLLSGIGFSDRLVRRPLYVGLLALFHKLGGVNYEGTVFVQILFLGLIPPFIYLLTIKISNRFAGFLAGGLVLLRETNAIDLSGKIVVSHAKLIMSDLTAMLGIIIFVYACVTLLTKPRPDKWLLLIIGSSLGLLALVRAQSLVLVPLILLFALIPQKTKKPHLINPLVILLGLVLTITPWVWRNWTSTGTLALGDLGEKTLMARNYSLSPVEYPRPLLGETSADFSRRLSRDILSFVFQHPRDLAFFISNHFMHSLALNAIYIAPDYSTDTPESLVSHNPFWDNWDGSLTGSNLFALLGNLAILAFGISLAQKDNKQAGWYPLLVFVVYQTGNALARTSGWRFALPVDWITLMYYCIALSYLPSRIGLLFSRPSPAIVDNAQITKPDPIYPGVFLFLFFIGGSVPLAERLIPKQNFDYLIDETKNTLIENNILTSEQLTQFLEQKNSVFISGSALYPRYYKPDGDIYLADMPKDFRYLHFWLLNDNDAQIVLPLEKPPEFFPHASTVSVIGCTDGNFISAWAVVLKTEAGKQVVVLQEPNQLLACP